MEAIESGFHAEISPPYLIYTQGGGKVRCVARRPRAGRSRGALSHSVAHARCLPRWLAALLRAPQVHGVWFYEEGDLNKIASLLAKVEASLPKPSQPPPAASAAAAQVIHRRACRGGGALLTRQCGQPQHLARHEQEAVC